MAMLTIDSKALAVLRKDTRNIRSSFTASLATVLGGQAACAAISLATEICYARLLGPELRGELSICMMAVALGVLIGGLGGDVPIVIWTAGAKKQSCEWLPAVMLWGILGCLVASSAWVAVYWHWHPAFLRGITSRLALIIAATIPPTVFSGYLMAMFTGAERFGLRAGLSFFEQTSALAAVVALVILFGQKPETAMLGNLFGLLVGAGISVIFLRHFFPVTWKMHRFDKSVVAGLRMGLRGQFGNVAAFFNYRLDVFIVNYFLDSTQVGLYALGVVISEGLWQIPQAAAVALFPRTARTIEFGAAEFTCRVMRQVLLIACVTGIAMALVAPFVVPLLFGARFMPSVIVIWWVLPGTIALALGKVASVDLTARGKNGYTSIFAILSFLLTAGLDWVLIPRMGIKGAALASSTAYFMNSVMLLVALRHELEVSWRVLLLPTYAELAAYQQAWLRCRAWLWPAAASAGGIFD